MMLVNPYIGFADNRFLPAVGPIVSNTDTLLGANYTFVGKYHPGALLRAGGALRLSLQGPSGLARTTTLSAVWIGHVGLTGNAYNFDGGQVQVMFGGAGNVSLVTGQVRTSDVIAFNIDPTKALLIAYNATNATYLNLRTALGPNYAYFVKNGVSQAQVTLKDVAGYTGAGGVSPYLRLLEAAP